MIRQLKKKTNRYIPFCIRQLDLFPSKLMKSRMEGRLYHRKYVSNLSRMSKEEPDKYKQILEMRKILVEGLMELD